MVCTRLLTSHFLPTAAHLNIVDKNHIDRVGGVEINLEDGGHI